ncbi:appA [Escherichia coli O104:H4 str. C227-11]|nr:appA [Escherichia coli O104:H4 str. C227-11]
MFERWRRLSDNSQWIQVSLVFQTLQQMRDKTPLSLNTPPGEVKLTLAGCEERNAQGMCSLAGFTQIVNEARIPPPESELPWQEEERMRRAVLAGYAS